MNNYLTLYSKTETGYTLSGTLKLLLIYDKQTKNL